jgi:3D (Asp-Asp-Asp) domain-containing protein
MKTLKLVVALLISIAFGVGAAKVLHVQNQNQTLVRQLNQKDTELSLAKTELKQTQFKLATAENQLGFLDKNKTAVQLTAYTAAPSFINGTGPAHSVTSHNTLPEDKVIYVALSPPLQSKLHAQRNDLIVLIHGHHKTIARFVDTTAPSEQRKVVDLLFANNEQAKAWGRHDDYYAVNISMVSSPFHRVLGKHGNSIPPQHRGQTG